MKLEYIINKQRFVHQKRRSFFQEKTEFPPLTIRNREGEEEGDEQYWEKARPTHPLFSDSW